MRSTLAFALTLTALLPAISSAGAPADMDKGRQQLIDLTNKQRAAESLSALKANATLMAAAQKHAENMARQEKAAHVLDGKSDQDRARAAGYAGVVGENVALSQRPKASEAAENTVLGWMKSPGHRANILQKAYTELGVGMARAKSGRWYLCQLFGFPVAGMKQYASIENKTGGQIRFELNAGGKPYEVANGTGFAVPVSLPKQGMVVRLLAADPAAAAIPITLRNGDRYVITKDGKGYKVQKTP